MNKTFTHMLEIGCSGLVGIFITIGYQHFFSPPPIITVIYNGEEKVITETTYIELIKENESLQTELLDTQNKLHELQEQFNVPENNTNNMQLGIPLTSLDYFSRTGNVQINYSFDSKNNYDTAYPYCITPFEHGEAFIEYSIDGEYTNLSGELYVTRHARFINPEYYTWDIATFAIYGDDIPLYYYTGFTTKDEPLWVDVDITGVKFLKIYFKDAHYYDTGMSESLIGFGNPMIK